MSDKNLRIFVAILLVISVSIVLAKIVFFNDRVDSYEGCVEAGYEVINADPPLCITPENTIFRSG